MSKTVHALIEHSVIILNILAAVNDFDFKVAITLFGTSFFGLRVASQ